MLNPPDEGQERLLLAFTHLEHNQDWDIVRSYLRQEAARLTEHLVAQNDEGVRGAIQVLNDLEAQAATARQEVNQIRVYAERTARP